MKKVVPIGTHSTSESDRDNRILSEFYAILSFMKGCDHPLCRCVFDIVTVGSHIEV